MRCFEYEGSVRDWRSGDKRSGDKRSRDKSSGERRWRGFQLGKRRRGRVVVFDLLESYVGRVSCPNVLCIQQVSEFKLIN